MTSAHVTDWALCAGPWNSTSKRMTEADSMLSELRRIIETRNGPASLVGLVVFFSPSRRSKVRPAFAAALSSPFVGYPCSDHSPRSRSSFCTARRFRSAAFACRACCVDPIMTTVNKVPISARPATTSIKVVPVRVKHLGNFVSGKVDMDLAR